MAYRRVVLRVACVFTGIRNFRYMVGIFDCLQYYLLLVDDGLCMAMLLAGEVTATAWLPTCDVISVRQWSYPGVHCLACTYRVTTVWRR